MSSELLDYFVFKFYVPDYGIQSHQIPVRADLVYKIGWRQSLSHAKDIFLSDGLKPIGMIHDGHLGLWEDGRITYKPTFRKLTREQASKMRRRVKGRQPKEKTGWKRSYRRSSHRARKPKRW